MAGAPDPTGARQQEATVAPARSAAMTARTLRYVTAAVGFRQDSDQNGGGARVSQILPVLPSRVVDGPR
jgi:hypothetical protein